MRLRTGELPEVAGRGDRRRAVDEVRILTQPPGGRVGGRPAVAQGRRELARLVLEHGRAPGERRHALVARPAREDDDADERGERRRQKCPCEPRRERSLLAGGRNHFRRRRLARREGRRERIAAGKRRRDLRRRGGPRRRILLEAAQDHALDDGIESRRDRRGRGRRVLGVLALELLERRALEGLAARVELVEHQPERVDVAADRRALARELLGRHVGRRARHLSVDDVARGDGQAEVGDARPAPAVDHHVGGLQVPMQHAPLVRGREARAELPRDVERLVRRQPPDALQKGREILAVDVLHREVLLPVDLGDVVDAADVGVRNLPGDADLGVKAIEAILVRGQMPRQELERHGLTELQIVRAVDLAHAAAAEQADDPVALGEDRAGREAARLDRVGRREPADFRRRGRAPSRLRHRRGGEIRRQLRHGRHGLAAGRTETRRPGNVGKAGWAADQVGRIVEAKKGRPRGRPLPIQSGASRTEADPRQ